MSTLKSINISNGSNINTIYNTPCFVYEANNIGDTAIMTECTSFIIPKIHYNNQILIDVYFKGKLDTDSFIQKGESSSEYKFISNVISFYLEDLIGLEYIYDLTKEHLFDGIISFSSPAAGRSITNKLKLGSGASSNRHGTYSYQLYVRTYLEDDEYKLSNNSVEVFDYCRNGSSGLPTYGKFSLLIKDDYYNGILKGQVPPLLQYRNIISTCYYFFSNKYKGKEVITNG